MADEIKFTKEEMDSLTQIQQSYATVANTIGQLGVNRIRLEQQLDDLDNADNQLKSQFVENQTKEREFVDSINKKYGDGNLDLTSGIFTPKATEETTKKTDKTL